MSAQLTKKKKKFRGSTRWPAVRSVAREKEACDLRLQGHTYRQIGEQLDISYQAAHQIVCRALLRVSEEANEAASEVFKLEVSRLDAMHLIAWRIAHDEGETPEQRLKGVDRCLRVHTARAKLYGLEKAPDVHVVVHKATVNERYARLDALTDGQFELLAHVVDIVAADDT